jgi:hypothetical protein
MKKVTRKTRDNVSLCTKGSYFDFGPEVLRCEQKEGKVFFAFGSKKAESISFIHSKANNSGIKGKSALRGIHKYLQKTFTFNHNSLLNSTFSCTNKLRKSFYRH